MMELTFFTIMEQCCRHFNIGTVLQDLFLIQMVWWKYYVHGTILR